MLTREDIGDIIEAKLRKAKLLPTSCVPEQCGPRCGPRGCMVGKTDDDLVWHVKARMWESPGFRVNCVNAKRRWREDRLRVRSKFYLRSSRP